MRAAVGIDNEDSPPSLQLRPYRRTAPAWKSWDPQPTKDRIQTGTRRGATGTRDDLVAGTAALRKGAIGIDER